MFFKKQKNMRMDPNSTKYLGESIADRRVLYHAAVRHPKTKSPSFSSTKVQS